MGLLQLIANTDHHDLPADAYRAAYTQARRDGDTTMLAVLASRLDLPADVAAELAQDTNSDVRKVWTSRPDVQARSGLEADVLAGETRGNVLASTLNSTSSPGVIAAVARRFAQKPTKAIAHAFLRRPLTDIPAEVAELILIHGGDGANPLEVARHRLCASLPYTDLTWPEHHARPKWGRHPYMLALIARPGHDASDGADLVTYMTGQVDYLIRKAHPRNYSLRHDDVAEVIASAIAYQSSGRTLPDGANTQITRLEAELARILGRGNHVARTLTDWITRGRPGLDNNVYFSSYARQFDDVPTPTQLPTLNSLTPAGTIDDAINDLDPDARARWAAHTTAPADFTDLINWATSRASSRATRYALLANPTLPTHYRDQLVHDLHTYANEVGHYPVLPNSTRRAATHALRTLTGPDRLAVYIAGGVSSQSVIRANALTPDEQATALRSFAAVANSANLTSSSKTDEARAEANASAALRQLLIDPDLDPNVVNHLPWPLMVDILSRPHSQSQLKMKLTAWLLTAATDIAGTDGTLWRLLSTLMPSSPATDKTLTVGDLLTAARAGAA